MPQIIDYAIVLQQMRSFGMKCVYYNSAAFAFLPEMTTRTVAWIGPADSTIRPEALQFTRAIRQPYCQTLAKMAADFWQLHLPGPIWVAPKSHWAHELQHGGRNWMAGALSAMQIDPAALADKTHASAIAFDPQEKDLFCTFAQALLENLIGSDFAILSPNFPLICTLHHHKQLWWTTPDAHLLEQADVIAKPYLYNANDIETGV